jgi:hypothetical protein
MQIDARNRGTAQALLADADVVLALAAVEQIEGPGMLEMVVNVRSGYRDLVRRGMSVTMTDDEQIKFQRKVDRMRACLRLFGESVYRDNFD